MKNILASITCCFIILCAGCNSGSTKSNENIVSDSTQSISQMNLMLCYALQNEKDTVSLNLVLVGDHVAGKLMYHYFEKDKNIGTLAGEKIGDTVFAKYTFMSEGLESQRYVSFLIKGDQAIEGYAPLNEKSGEPDFSDHSKIQFDNKFVLQKTDCK